MFKKGDEVISIRLGLAKVVQIDGSKPYVISIKCAKDNTFKTRTAEGRAYEDDYLPDIYYAKGFIPPSAPEPVRHPDLKIDTKVWVWNTNEPTKHKRHFSHFTKNKIVCFIDGNSSWTTNSATIWANYELADEENE